ncbi:glycosyltransferase [Candidatus Microgenomates bacterium]|nr:glycosyltransferase [Candidatus Microgenomates bacterium]
MLKNFYRKLPLKYRRDIKFFYYSFFRFTESLKKKPKLRDIPDGPKISVVVPVFRHERYLRECIDSILSQSYTNFELILVNDDPDNKEIEKILREYENNLRVKILHNESNIHVSESLNRGIRKSTGEYVAFVDCDDALCPYSLQEVVKYILENGSWPDFISTKYVVISEKGRLICCYNRPKNPNIFQNMWASHLKVIRRDVFEKIGYFDPKWSGIQDYEFALRAEKNGCQIHYLQKYLYKYREHAETYTTQKLKSQYERSDALKELYALDKKLKILYLITQSEWGGAQRYVYDLATNMVRDFEVVVAGGGEGHLSERLEQTVVRFVALKHLIRPIRPFRDLLAFFEILTLLRREKPDILHLNSSKAVVLGSLAGRLSRFRPKIIATAHGLAYHEPGSIWKKQFYKLFEKIGFGLADRIICVSRFDYGSGIKNHVFKASKATIIYNGLLAKVSPSQVDVKAKFLHKDEACVVGTIANFYPNKGLEYLLRVAKLIQDKRSDISFVVAGDGVGRRDIESQIAELGLKNVKLIGFIDDTEKFLQECDIFVLSSLKEGLPYVILEAMAMGLPIVATKVGGVPEMVDDNVAGFLVSPADSEALAEKIEILANDSSLCLRFGQSGARKLRIQFTPDKMLCDTKSIYIKLLAKVTPSQ